MTSTPRAKSRRKRFTLPGTWSANKRHCTVAQSFIALSYPFGPGVVGDSAMRALAVEARTSSAVRRLRVDAGASRAAVLVAGRFLTIGSTRNAAARFVTAVGRDGSERRAARDNHGGIGSAAPVRRHRRVTSPRRRCAAAVQE